MIAESRHTLLGQRIMWWYDTNAIPAVAIAERHHSKYDDRWRMVGVFDDADSPPKESFMYHAAGNVGSGRSALRADSDGTDTAMLSALRRLE